MPAHSPPPNPLRHFRRETHSFYTSIWNLHGKPVANVASQEVSMATEEPRGFQAIPLQTRRKKRCWPRGKVPIPSHLSSLEDSRWWSRVTACPWGRYSGCMTSRPRCGRPIPPRRAPWYKPRSSQVDLSGSLPTGFLLRLLSPLAGCPPRSGQLSSVSPRSQLMSLLCSKPLLIPFPCSTVLPVVPGPYATWPLASLPSAPSPVTSSAPATPSSLPLLEPTRHALISRPLHLPVPSARNAVPADKRMASSLASLLSLFKSHGSVRPPCPCLPSQSSLPGACTWSIARIAV